jgi:hypothetical protein
MITEERRFMDPSIITLLGEDKWLGVPELQPCQLSILIPIPMTLPITHPPFPRSPLPLPSPTTGGAYEQ